MFTSEWIEDKAKLLRAKLKCLSMRVVCFDGADREFDECDKILELLEIYAQSREEARRDNLKQQFKVVQFEQK